MDLQKLVKYGSTLGGPDKVVKFSQNLCKFVAYYLAKNGNPELAAEWGRFASYASLARKAFRCNQDIASLGKLVALQKKAKSLPTVDYMIQLSAILSYEIFIFFDHFLMASMVKFMARDKPYWLKVSCFGWTWSCIFKALAAMRVLQANSAKLAALAKESKPDKAEAKKLLLQRKEAGLDVLMNLSDAVCAGSIIDYDKNLTGSKISNGTYGFCGMIASVLAARAVYKKC